MKPSLTQLAAPLKETTLPLTQLQHHHSQQRLPLTDYCNQLALHAAESYTSGNLPFQAADTLVTNIHTLMAHAKENGTIKKLPQPAFSIFQAFGSENEIDEIKQILAATHKDHLKNTKEEESNEPWWSILLVGLFVIAGSFLFYNYFVEFENSQEESRTMNAVLATLYNLLGKEITCGIIALAGIGITIQGINKRRRMKQPPAIGLTE